MEYFVPLPGTTPPVFDACTLVLPQPSLASIPQLAVDLLVHSLALPLVGYLGLRDHVPAVSGLDSLAAATADTTATPPPHGITFAVQVYHSDEHKVTLVLPRSPVIKARKAHYLASLAAFIDAAGFADILLVSSVDAAMRGDAALALPTPLRSLVPRTQPTTPSAFASRLSRLPPYSSSPSEDTVPPLPASGLTRALLTALPSSCALLIYAAEGHALEPAHELADTLAALLTFEKPVGGWTAPKSWEMGLLGDELGRVRIGELYG